MTHPSIHTVPLPKHFLPRTQSEKFQHTFQVFRLQPAVRQVVHCGFKGTYSVNERRVPLRLQIGLALAAPAAKRSSIRAPERLVPRLVIKCSGKIEQEASELDSQSNDKRMHTLPIEYKYKQQITSSFLVLEAKLTEPRAKWQPPT